MWRGLIFKWSATPHPKGRGRSAPKFRGFPQFSGVPLYLCVYPFLTTRFHMETHMGRGLVFRWSAALQPQADGVPALPNFGGFSCILNAAIL